MNATIDATAAVTAFATTQVRANQQDTDRRLVEPTERGSLQSTSDDTPSRTAPVVQLVRRSAQQFLNLLKAGTAPAIAAAQTGFTAAPTSSDSAGRLIDTVA